MHFPKRLTLSNTRVTTGQKPGWVNCDNNTLFLVNMKIPGDEFEFSISLHPKSGKGPQFFLNTLYLQSKQQQTKKKQEMETLRFIKELYYKHQDRKGVFSWRKKRKI